MNDTAAWSNRKAPGHSDEKSSMAEDALSLFALCLVLGLGAGLWICAQGDHSVSALRAILRTAAGGVACFGVVFTTLRIWQKKSRQSLEAFEQEWRNTVTGLQLQVADARIAV